VLVRGMAFVRIDGDHSSAAERRHFSVSAGSTGFLGGFMLRSAIHVAILIAAGVAPAAAQDAKTQGDKVFAEQKCTLCHSVGGKGNPKGPLDDVGDKLSAGDIREWITDAKGMTAKTKATRKPEMKAYTLPKEDVDALVAYLSTMKKK
jgi:mono/diheme cytochrome c family protein